MRDKLNIKKQKISYTLSNLSCNDKLIEAITKDYDINVALLDIDHFGCVNDTYGFDIGDSVIEETARLLEFLKPADTQLFRLNSDEFVLVDDKNMSDEKIKFMLDSILSFFSESEVSVEDEIDVKISFSIGIAKGRDIKVLNKAKVAIKELREHQRNAYKFFDPNSIFLKKQDDNIYWVHKLKQAIVDRKLIPFFQPIINNKTDKIEKYECLARIEDEELLIPPIRFMEAAKLTGMLPFITQSMIEQSCKSFANSDFDFSFNITSDDFHLDYLEKFLLKHTSKNNIDPSKVILEILEDISSLEDEKTLRQLHSLREKGFKIAIDDFGRMSSNFSRLLEFNPDYLKIDGTFIKDILNDSKSQIITEAIVLISHKSNIKVIAEYVHNKEINNKLVELGVDYSQGYYFSEPKKYI